MYRKRGLSVSYTQCLDFKVIEFDDLCFKSYRELFLGILVQWEHDKQGPAAVILLFYITLPIVKGKKD